MMGLESSFHGLSCQSGLVGVLLLALGNFTFAQTCPPPYTPTPDSFSYNGYISARQQCTDACNALGYCRNVGMGGWDKVPCTTGCHIAFFSDDLAACYAECNNANNNVDGAGCVYTHERHPDVADLGFNPFWTDWTDREHAVSTCRESFQCGCPAESWGSGGAHEGTYEACLAGCDLANDPIRSGNFFKGLDALLDPRSGLDGEALLGALDDLTDHVAGVTLLSETDLLNRRQVISDNQALLETNLTHIDAATNLIDEYETSYGPLFVNAKTYGGFARESATDGKNLERTILFVQQAILDQVYHGSLYEFTMEDKPFEAVVGDCQVELGGRKWLTSQFFPGDVDPPSDKTVDHAVDINATMPTFWGKKVTYCDKQVIRPTGLYLAPGEIASVTVPSAMVDAGFRIQVGANTIDNSNKDWHRRMDRITSTYDIKATITYVANPLGGGVYIRIPYEAKLGVQSLTISGGVVQAPIFSKTSIKTTTEAEWNARRIAPGPWADFETDRFLLQVPRIWMYALSYAHVDQLVTDWDRALDGALEFSGFLSPDLRNNYVLYVNPDLHIRHNTYGIGYPQVNNQLSADTNGPQPHGPLGASDHWLLNDPVGWDTDYHELGHQFDHTRYRGETEAVVNLLITYAQNVKFDYDFDQAFINSFPRTGYFTVDGAAINWMVAENFRGGDNGGPIPGEMRYWNPYNQFQYQHRGYAKYADIARLFGGWQIIADFYYQENVDIMNDVQSPCPGLSDEDYRTFKLSLVVGFDLTPLIHFWGIHPVNSAALAQCMQVHNLGPSLVVKQRIEHYKSIIPMNYTAFLDHFQEVWPGMKDKDEDDPPVGPHGWRCVTSKSGVPDDQLYGCGWYNHWYPQWNEVMATDTVDAVQNVLDLYYPSELPSSAPSVGGLTFPTLYVNCGGGEILDGSRTWDPDTLYLNNQAIPAYSSGATISNLGAYPEALYQSERWDNGLGLMYTIPNVDPGVYEIKIHLAEIYFAEIGQRVMGVTVEDIPIIQNLDIVQTAGPLTAYVVTHEVEVLDGAITIELVTAIENPKISGFEIRQISTDSAAPSSTLPEVPSHGPSSSPSEKPSSHPSAYPSTTPSIVPSTLPSKTPTIGTMPSSSPSEEQSTQPSTSPSTQPSPAHSTSPSTMPSVAPLPSSSPSGEQSMHPSTSPSDGPSVVPSTSLSQMPSVAPLPSSSPSREPSVHPSTSPSGGPLDVPSQMPSVAPLPSSSPSEELSTHPSTSPSDGPSVVASTSPSQMPSVAPLPSDSPSQAPTVGPFPSNSPSDQPTEPPACLGNKQRCFADGDCCSNNCHRRRCRGNRRLLRSLEGIQLAAEEDEEEQYQSFEERTEPQFSSAFELEHRALIGPPGGMPDQAMNGLDVAAARADLNNARGLWLNRAIRSYNVELEVESYGPMQFRGPFIVQVRNGVVTDVLDRFSGLAVEPYIAAELPTTTEELYDLIDTALNFGPEYVGVDYARGNGRPKRIHIVPGLDKKKGGDGIRIYYLRNFEAVRNESRSRVESPRTIRRKKLFP